MAFSNKSMYFRTDAVLKWAKNQQTKASYEQEDGYATAHLSRIIKSLEFIFVLPNVLGLVASSIKTAAQDVNMEERMLRSMTILVIIQVLLECVIIWYRFKQFKEQYRLDKPLKPLAMAQINSNHMLEAIHYYGLLFAKVKKYILEYLRLHFFLIFLQPTILYGQEFNKFMWATSLLRLYVLLRFYILSSQYQNARFRRVFRHFLLDKAIIGIKLLFSPKRIKESLLMLLFIVTVGYGHFLSETEINNFRDLLSGIYHLVITLGTVGFGDLKTEVPYNRIGIFLVTVSGTLLNGILVIFVLRNFMFDRQEHYVYHLMKRVQWFDKQEGLAINRLCLLLDMQQLQTQLDDVMTAEMATKKVQLCQKFKTQHECQNMQAQVASIGFQFSIDNHQQWVENDEKALKIVNAYNEGWQMDEQQARQQRCLMDEIPKDNPIVLTQMSRMCSRAKLLLEIFKLRNNLINQLHEG